METEQAFIRQIMYYRSYKTDHYYHIFNIILARQLMHG